MINARLIGNAGLEAEYHLFKLFKIDWSVSHLFRQLDNLQTVMEQLQRNISLNATLALEKVLLAYRKDETMRC